MLDLSARFAADERMDRTVEEFQVGMEEDKTDFPERSKRKRSQVSRSVVVRAWRDSGLAIVPNWNQAERLCWRCGDPPQVCGRSNLDRAHMVPHALGGNDHPTNIVLLCDDCHHWGPNFIDPRFMRDYVQELTKYEPDERERAKKNTHARQMRLAELGWMILAEDVADGKTTWRKIGNRFAYHYKTKTVHHFSRNGDLFSDRLANSVAIFQTIIDELPDD